jgi:hypothetical protein
VPPGTYAVDIAQPLVLVDKYRKYCPEHYPGDPPNRKKSGDCGWRANLDIRQRVAAVGRRVNTLCQGEDGLQHQLALFHVYHNFVLAHASLRQPLQVPESANGSGSAKVWRPCTPAMTAGLTDHVWSLKEVLLCSVPPWPQPRVR